MAIINIVVNPVSGGWSPWDTRLGGTEESVVEWATRLKELGHDVTVYHNGQHGEFKGVPFVERSEYLNKRKKGITLNCNYPDLPVQEPTYFLTNLTNVAEFDLSGFEGVIHPSHWARDNLGAVHETQFILPHGYDPGKIYYDESQKVPKTVLYASSPDRGLAELAAAWPMVASFIPEAHLFVTYNGQINVPNCTCLGNADDELMAELFRSADVWCHPCTGGELFGMSGVKAQVAGCYPVFYPTMALNETVKVGRRTDREHLAGDLIEVLQGHPKISTETLDFADWEESTKQLETILLQS